VIILSDQALTTRISTMPRPDLKRVPPQRRALHEPNGEFRRFELTESGVSAAAVPGTPGATFTATGLEHNERGNPNAEPATHTAMMAKRSRKMQLALEEQDDLVRWWGDPNGTVGVMGWGSSEGVIREAVQRAIAEGIPTVALHPRLLHPLPDKHVRRLMRQCRRILVPEGNFSGQFIQYLRSQYFDQWNGVDEYKGRWTGEFVPLNKCDGMPFTSKEILDGIRGIAG
jgi:2-oxoglutarate ferredoxin oxidoreductase subunit alpha